MSTHKPLRLPESMTRVDIGPYMRGLREHFALSQQDVSERLHIRHRYINAIENNAFDQMPGRAYAKGYVHTYAEFLGLDADQAVEICFGPEPVREQQNHFVPQQAKRGSGSLPGQWRSVAVVAVIIALGVLGIAQFTTGEEEGSSRPTVGDVPEEMLADMRRLLMPTAQNHRCLQEETPLGCLLDARDWQRLAVWMQGDTVYLVDAEYGRPLSEKEKQRKAVPAPVEVEKPVTKPEPAPKKPAPKKTLSFGKVPDAKPEGTKNIAEPLVVEPKPEAADAE